MAKQEAKLEKLTGQGNSLKRGTTGGGGVGGPPRSKAQMAGMSSIDRKRKNMKILPT